MVGKDGIVQDEVVVAVRPVVTNVRVPLNNQVGDSKSVQASSNHETVLTATDDEDRRI